MNPIIENILTRRSVRDFKDTSIEQEKLMLLAKAATYAPSGRNLQTWHFTVVQNKELISKLAYVIANHLDRGPDYNFYGATALILASSHRDSPFAKEDCACALENIFLAANSLGIGSVWINQLKDICDEPAIRDVLRMLKVPENNLVFGVAALGYPASAPTAPTRADDTITFIP